MEASVRVSNQSCPSCGGETTRVLDRISPDAHVSYHRCDSCGHVWVTFTDGRQVHNVTPLKGKKARVYEPRPSRAGRRSG